MSPLNAVWYAVAGSCLLHECSLLPGQWLTSPCALQNKSPVTHLPTPIALCALYALAEPLYSVFMIWLAVPPWLLAGLVPSIFHLGLGLWMPNLLYSMLPPTTPIVASDPSHDPKDAVPPSGPAKPAWVIRMRRWKLSLPLLLAVNTSAASNAAMLLLLQSLDAQTPAKKTFQGMLIMDCVDVIAYLFCRYADVSISWACRRAQYVGQYGMSLYTRDQLLNVAVLILMRAAVRRLLGLSVVFGRYPGAPEELFGTHRWQWINAMGGQLE